MSQSLKEQEEQGLYQEEVQKLVDGVVEDIRNGHLKSRRVAMEQLMECCGHSRYLKDMASVITVLLWSKCPSFGFVVMPEITPDTRAELVGDGSRPFPWGFCAASALKGECGRELRTRPEYLALP